MYGNNQRVHIIQVDIWVNEHPEAPARPIEVTVHRMAWEREASGEFSLSSDFENRYHVAPSDKGLWRFIDVLKRKVHPPQVWLNGARSSWPDVEEAICDAGRTAQNGGDRGACLLSTKFVEE